MTRAHCLGFAAVFVLGWNVRATEPDLSAYRTIETAITAQLRLAPSGVAGQTGYLGVSLQRDGRGRLVVEEVQPGSPAAKAGVQKGDVVTRVGVQPVKTPEMFREWLQARSPGEAVTLSLLRADQPLEVTATLAATSRPMKLGMQRVFFGAELGAAQEGAGVRVERVVPNSPAAAAGLQSGDHILKLEGGDLTRAARLTNVLSEKRPGDTLLLA
ncbi:MAG: PDZ domain-containing protein, partial [Gemmataceae bacterium]|nr:PDZ domain-containing protein [Gemmataceae bacterium]